MFDKEAKQRVLDYYFEDTNRTPLEVCSHFGYPKTRTLSLWIQADPRWLSQANVAKKALKRYSEDEKAAVIDYYRKHPNEKLSDICLKFGYPTECCLRAWLEKAGFSPEKKNTPTYSTKQVEEICKYAVEHPEMTRVDVCNLFGYPSSGGILTNWCIERYGEAGKPQAMYPAKQKAWALDEIFSDASVPVKEVLRRIGLPHHVMTPLVREDPRWENDPRNPAVKSRIVGEMVEYYFEDVARTFKEVSERFGQVYSAAGVAKIIRRDPRYGNPGFYGFTDEQRDAVISLLVENPKLKTKDLPKELGLVVPIRVVAEWRLLDPSARAVRKSMRNAPRRPFEVKHECVSLIVKDGLSRGEVAKRLGLPKTTVTNWLRNYRRRGMISLVNKSDIPARRRTDNPVPDKKAKDFTTDDVELLIARNRELEFENDVLRAIFDTLKKEPSLDETDLSNREKTLIINALRPKYKLRELLEWFGLAKSSYEYTCEALRRGDKYAWLRPIILQIYNDSEHAFGPRRIWGKLRKPRDKGGFGIRVSEKVVRRLAKEMGLVTLPAMKLKRYNAYRGSVGTVAPNLLERDFHADAPWEKLLSDITEFHFNGIKAYLSPLIDCYNGEVVAYTISMRPKLKMVMEMLSTAIEEAPADASPIVHTDQGAQYQSHAFVEALEKAGWVQSMSRSGCCSDNSACEGFFGRLKNEFFYNHDFTGCTFDQFRARLSSWIQWYNYERIKESLDFMSPVEYRLENARLAA